MSAKRARAGSWSIFERRFRPLSRIDGSRVWDRSEMTAREVIDWREWWTVLDCDVRLYLSAGYRFVNRIGYVRCAIPWSDADQFRHYRYA